ncbi:MAG: iron-containing alcohol dehydrogenase [Bacillota bacterium]
MPYADFSFSVPGQVRFGVGIIKQLPAELEKNGINNVLVVSDPGVVKAGLPDEMFALFREAGIGFTLFDQVEPNPSVETVVKALEAYQENGCQGMVAFGGGSPIDTAKALGVLATNGGELTQYEGVGKFKNPPPPLWVIPTTAGTGSEATPFAVITHRQTNYKFPVAGPSLIPRLALLDPTLITTLPPHVAASTGMDALTHAIESYLSLAAHPFSECMSEKAIALVGRHLRNFVANRQDLEAAGGMLLASLFGGIAFAHARLGLVHAMAHPLGGFFNVPHGVANAVLLPYVMQFNLLADKGKYERIAQLLGEDLNGLSSAERAQKAVEAVETLNRDLGIPAKISAVGVKKEAIPQMAVDTMKSGNVKVNPRQAVMEDVIRLFELAY